MYKNDFFVHFKLINFVGFAPQREHSEIEFSVYDAY